MHARTSYFVCQHDWYIDRMYRIDEAKKRDAKLRWALPNRVFFACGACHILAFAFLEQYGSSSLKAIWIKPASGFTGNHILITASGWVFDYHGYSCREHFFTHTYRKADRWWPGWQATLMTEGKRPLSVGFFFSLGHSSVVFILAVLLNFGIRGLDQCGSGDLRQQRVL